MKRRIILSSLLVVGGLSIAVAAQQQQQPKTLEVTKLKDNLYVLKSADERRRWQHVRLHHRQWRRRCRFEEPRLGPADSRQDQDPDRQAVTTLINTHTHGDHVSGNVDFPASVDIIVRRIPRRT